LGVAVRAVGFFACAYIVEGSSDSAGVTLSTSVYAELLDRRAFFSRRSACNVNGVLEYVATVQVHSILDLPVLCAEKEYNFAHLEHF